MTSIHLVLRSDQHCDLHVEKISQLRCRLDVEPDSGGDNGIVIRLTLKGGSMSGDAESKINHPVDYTASHEQVCKDHRDIMRVWNSCQSNSVFVGHPQFSPNVNLPQTQRVHQPPNLELLRKCLKSQGDST